MGVRISEGGRQQRRQTLTSTKVRRADRERQTGKKKE